MLLYAEVLLDVANRRLDESFHYIVPEGMTVRAGAIVQAPLKNRQVRGLVAALTAELPPGADFTPRPLSAVLEDDSLIPPDMLELAHWLAETTICPLALSLHTVWPFLRGRGEIWYSPAGAWRAEAAAEREETDERRAAVRRCLRRSRRGALPAKILARRAGVDASFLRDCEAEGLLGREIRFPQSSGGAPAPAGAAGSAAPEPAGMKSGAEPAGSGGGRAKPAPGSYRADADWESRLTARYDLPLTPPQADAWRRAAAAWAEGWSTVLLHGVTGSGKTLVYGRAVAEVIACGGQAIVLVPEISLTSQIAAFFTARFGAGVAVAHSGLKAEEKLAVWEKCLRGEVQILVGARSAVFAPFPRLGLIIIDEEHDGAYKQDENPKYHARDVARRRLPHGLVLLGSATPSLEAYAAAARRQISRVTLPARYNQSALPQIVVADMKRELATGNKSVLSLPLREALTALLARGEQAILFLNRRGYATFILCRECGHVVSCPHCDVALTFHQKTEALRCHYCNHREYPVKRCPRCGSRFIRYFGQGTQKAEEAVREIWPQARLLRLDRDTATAARGPENILASFRRREADILIGTQMLAKGLDFPHVTLVGIIAADQMLNMPDFRARERAFQLFTQVAGRAGRGLRPGMVILQTYAPEDRTVLHAAAYDYELFAREELAYRSERRYPPFSHMLRLMIFHGDEARAAKAACALAAALQAAIASAPHLRLLGPAPAVLTRLKNEYRWQIILQGKDPAELRQAAHRGVAAFYRDGPTGGVRLSLDFNPLQ
ncbi:MAG: primosomal protein N' [Gracilibacteraceae bacterium]|jgi:primosomal protein N' (replication factor Y)|nr:primosomal protein N' [Gracilibacteraceae bacterium]